jgi:hypothetical protein
MKWYNSGEDKSTTSAALRKQVIYSVWKIWILRQNILFLF